MKHLKRIVIALIYAGICLFSYKIGESCGVKKGIEDSKLTINNLPTIAHIQGILGIKEDNKLGRETQIKWQQAIDATVFNDYASEYSMQTGKQ